MNLASIVVLGVVAVLFILSVISSRTASADKCRGNCNECKFRRDGIRNGENFYESHTNKEIRPPFFISVKNCWRSD